MVGAAINILFFDKDRTQVRRLLQRNGFIDEYSFGVNRYDFLSLNEKFRPYAIYKIALKDDNGDSRINEADNTPYYLSDLDGTNLRQITPDSLNLTIAWYSDDFNEIYFDEVIEDKSNPLAFTGYFEKTRNIYFYSLLSDEFKPFSKLQEEFNNVQNTFSNSGQ